MLVSHACAGCKHIVQKFPLGAYWQTASNKNKNQNNQQPLAILQCVSVKKFTLFKKSPHMNISKYFQEMSIHVGSYGYVSFYQMIPKNLTILYAWVSRSHICEIDQNPGLTAIGICSVCYEQNWESWKGFKIIILMVDDTLWKNMLCCVYILTYAIDILCFIELLITLLSVLVTFCIMFFTYWPLILWKVGAKRSIMKLHISMRQIKKCYWYMGQNIHWYTNGLLFLAWIVIRLTIKIL